MAMAARLAVGLLVAATVRAEESATVCNIRDHGAVGDGSHLDTAALNACIKLGAGVTILVPAVAGSCGHHNLSSCYLTGAINLTSHQTLRIEKGAGLIGSVHLDKSQSPPDCSHCSWDLQHYPRLPSLPSYDDARYAALVSSYNATGVRIEGEGLLDGQGWALWPDHVQSNLTAQRPHLVELYSCTKCVVEDVVLRNSAFWTLHVRCYTVAPLSACVNDAC
jgi:polygalacturonase